MLPVSSDQPSAGARVATVGWGWADVRHPSRITAAGAVAFMSTGNRPYLARIELVDALSEFDLFVHREFDAHEAGSMVSSRS